MPRTYSDAITRARRILQDENPANYRYSEESLMDAVNDALLEVRRIRPDLFLSRAFDVPVVALADADTTNLPVEDFIFQAVVYLVVGNQMLRDNEFSLDSRAVNLLNKGIAQLQDTRA